MRWVGSRTADRARSSQPLSNTAHTPAHWGHLGHLHSQENTHTRWLSHTLKRHRKTYSTDRDIKNAQKTDTQSLRDTQICGADTFFRHGALRDRGPRSPWPTPPMGAEGGGVPAQTPAPLPGCKHSEVHYRRTYKTFWQPLPWGRTPPPRAGARDTRAGGCEATAATSKNKQLVTTCGLRRGRKLARR